MVTLKYLPIHPPLLEELTKKQHISTPHALLARNPTQLCTSLSSYSTAALSSSQTSTVERKRHHHHQQEEQHSLREKNPISLHTCLNFRAAVADASIASKDFGRDAAYVTASASSVIRKHFETCYTYRNPFADSNDDDAVDNDKSSVNNDTLCVSCRVPSIDRGKRKREVDDDGCVEVQVPMFHEFRPPPVCVGAYTALDLCLNDGGRRGCGDMKHECVSTGSRSLDELLQLDGPFTCDGSVIEPSSILPKNFIDGLRLSVSKKRGTGIVSQSASNARREFCGGVSFGNITEFCGPPSSGKSQIALTVTANAALNLNTQVHYLVSEGGSTKLSIVRRLLKICQNRALQMGVTDDRIISSLENVKIAICKDAYKALKHLSALEDKLSSSKDYFHQIVVVDSVSGCLYPNFLSKKNIDGGQGAFLVTEVGLALRRLTRIYNVAALVLNGVVKSNTSLTHGLQPALGSFWRFSDIKVILTIIKTRYSNANPDSTLEIVGQLWKHVSMSVKQHPKANFKATSRFTVEESGICDIVEK